MAAINYTHLSISNAFSGSYQATSQYLIPQECSKTLLNTVICMIVSIN